MVLGHFVRVGKSPVQIGLTLFSMDYFKNNTVYMVKPKNAIFLPILSKNVRNTFQQSCCHDNSGCPM